MLNRAIVLVRAVCCAAPGLVAARQPSRSRRRRARRLTEFPLQLGDWQGLPQPPLRRRQSWRCSASTTT